MDKKQNKEMDKNAADTKASGVGLILGLGANF